MIPCCIGPLLPLLHLLQIMYHNFKQILIKWEKGIWGRERERERTRVRVRGREVGTDGSACPVSLDDSSQESWDEERGRWLRWCGFDSNGRGCFEVEYVRIWLPGGKRLRRWSKQTSFNGIGMRSKENMLQRDEPNTSVVCDKEKSVEVQSSHVNMVRKPSRGAREQEWLLVKCIEVMQRKAQRKVLACGGTGVTCIGGPNWDKDCSWNLTNLWLFECLIWN
jgi:hypothetical protein